MTDDRETTFSLTSRLAVPPGELTRVPLSRPPNESAHVAYVEDGVVFRCDGWYEILIAVECDARSLPAQGS